MSRKIVKFAFVKSAERVLINKGERHGCKA